MNRIILHIDMDAFFASVEERENPHFRGKPIVVGADPAPKQVWYGAGPKRKLVTVATGRGVVSTANYEARKYGIHSALPISEAWRKCPLAVFLPPNMELYARVSQRVFDIVKSYSDIWEIVSVDEAYLDISFLNDFGEAKALGEKIKKEILEKEKLNSTIGIGPNKIVAKIATNKSKPDGLFVVKPEEVGKFLEPFDIEEVPGIGPKTAAKLRPLGVNTIGDFKRFSKKELKKILGKVGKDFYEMARGIDDRLVTSEEVIKSIGRQYTFEEDTRDPEAIFTVFDQLIREIGRELFSTNSAFRTITVVCRFHGFETHTKAKTLKATSKDLKVLKSEAKKLLLRFLLENPKPVRLVGIRAQVC